MKLRLYLEPSPAQDDQGGEPKGPQPHLDSLTGQPYLETDEHLAFVPQALAGTGLKVVRARLRLVQAYSVDSPPDGDYHESDRLDAFVLNEMGTVDDLLTGDIQTITVNLRAATGESLADLSALHEYLGRILRHEVSPATNLSRRAVTLPPTSTPAATTPDPAPGIIPEPEPSPPDRPLINRNHPDFPTLYSLVVGNFAKSKTNEWSWDDYRQVAALLTIGLPQ